LTLTLIEDYVKVSLLCSSFKFVKSLLQTCFLICFSCIRAKSYKHYDRTKLLVLTIYLTTLQQKFLSSGAYQKTFQSQRLQQQKTKKLLPMKLLR